MATPGVEGYCSGEDRENRNKLISVSKIYTGLGEHLMFSYTLPTPTFSDKQM